MAQQSQNLRPVGGSRLPIVDWFIPYELASNERDFARARLLVSLSLAYALITSISWFWLYFFAPFDERYRNLSSMMLVPITVFFLLAPVLLRRFKHYSLIANLSIFMALLSITVGIALSGGPIESVVNYLILLPPFMAILLLGFRGGALWSALAFGAEISMIYQHFQGYRFPQLWDTRYYQLIEVLSWLISFVTSVSTALIYERLHQRLSLALEAKQQEYRFLATHDGLTRIPNRTLFDDRVERAIHRVGRSGGAFAVLFIDLDGFKPINDRYGHAAGDKTLICVAQRLQSMIRKADTVARLGGDEFAVLLMDVAKPSDIERVLAALLAHIAEPIGIDDYQVALSASVGVAFCPTDGKSLAELKRRADMAMYRAKRRKNAYCIYDANIDGFNGSASSPY